MTTKSKNTLSNVEIPKEFFTRYDTGSEIVNDVLGGGVFPGAMYIVSGNPSAGKSTWSLMLLDSIKKYNDNVQCMLFTGEESKERIKLRMDDLNKHLKNAEKTTRIVGNFLIEDKMPTVRQLISKIVAADAKVVVIDSLQKLQYDGKRSNQAILRAAEMLYNFAGKNKVAIIAICQANKKGEFAGLQAFIHEVDVHIHISSLSKNGRVIEKNRFGKGGVTF